jgi:hypothetical protein
MLKSEIEAHIHFKHLAGEVEALNRAIIPMAECIVAVSSGLERQKMRQILGCNYFRARNAANMTAMLLRASKYAKLHLGDYFPMMRAQILDDALALESAAMEYRSAFDALKNETLPTH